MRKFLANGWQLGAKEDCFGSHLGYEFKWGFDGLNWSGMKSSHVDFLKWKRIMIAVELNLNADFD